MTEKPPRKWGRWVFVVVLALGVAWVSCHDAMTAAVGYLALDTGDTIAILDYRVHASVTVNPTTGSSTTTRYLGLKFKSTLSDPSRDSLNARAIARVICPQADSLGVTRVTVMPTSQAYLGLLSYSLHHSFDSDGHGSCTPVRGD